MTMLKKKPKAPCEGCQAPKCEGIWLQKFQCRAYKDYLNRLIHYYEQSEQEKAISCRTCPLGCENMYYEPVKVGRVKAPPGKILCLAEGKIVSPRDCRGHEYPAWCVRNCCQATCLVCGCRLFPHENYSGVCLKCSVKKKNRHLIFKYQ